MFPKINLTQRETTGNDGGRKDVTRVVEWKVFGYQDVGWRYLQHVPKSTKNPVAQKQQYYIIYYRT